MEKSLIDIENELKGLTEDQSTITTVELKDILSLIQRYGLNTEVKDLLSKKIASKKSELLRTLSSVPRSIQKPIEWATRIDNADKKISLLLDSINDFITKIEALDPKEYKLYTVEEERTPTAFAITKRGNENIGNKFLGRKYNIQELDNKRVDILDQLQKIKSTLDIVKRSLSIVDTKNQSQEWQETFDELRTKITTQEEDFLKIYDAFSRLIIPYHIAREIDPKKLYEEETISAKIEEYFKGKYGLNEKNESIPNGIDPDSLDFQKKTRPYEDTGRIKSRLHGMPTFINFLEKDPVISPVSLRNIFYIPLQYPLYEHLSYPNPDHEKSQAILKKYSNS